MLAGMPHRCMCVANAVLPPSRAVLAVLQHAAATRPAFILLRARIFFSGGNQLALLLAGRDTSRFLFC